MYAFRTTIGPPECRVDLAFTDRVGGVSAPPYDELDLAVGGPDPEPARAENLRRLLADFAPGDAVADLHQVHGTDVEVLAGPPAERPRADALVTGSRGLVLLVRAADCVPVLLADTAARVVAAVHVGRAGLAAGVVPATLERMRRLGARSAKAWLGPHICGACYEVPEPLQAAVAERVPESRSSTSWGTASLDLGAGVRAQLGTAGIGVVDVSRCTRESAELYSYRRDGSHAGRQAGLVRIRPAGAGP